MKSIKQIADDLGIDKQRVYRYIRKSGITASDQTIQTALYDETAEMQIKSHFSGDTASQKSDRSDTETVSLEVVIDLLRTELEAKNRQIEVLQSQVSDLTTALGLTSAALHDAQALHAGTMQQQLQAAGDPESEDQETKKTPWWAFWRR